MSIQIDNAELMSLLESSDIHTSSQVRELIQEQLNTGKNHHTKLLNASLLCHMNVEVLLYVRTCMKLIVWNCTTVHCSFFTVHEQMNILQPLQDNLC